MSILKTSWPVLCTTVHMTLMAFLVIWMAFCRRVRYTVTALAGGSCLVYGICIVLMSIFVERFFYSEWVILMFLDVVIGLFVYFSVEDIRQYKATTSPERDVIRARDNMTKRLLLLMFMVLFVGIWSTICLVESILGVYKP